MKFLSIIIALFLIAGCSKRDDLAAKDTLLVAPHTEPATAIPVQDNNTGLVVDSFVTRQQPEIDTLKRLDPKRVVEIYDAYRPLRKHATTQAQLDSFLRSQKINEHELHAVLTEGDRLGWTGPANH
jgi:hypothetical protein